MRVPLAGLSTRLVIRAHAAPPGACARLTDAELVRRCSVSTKEELHDLP